MSPLSATAASAFSTSAKHTLTTLAHRSLESDINDVKQTFSSWDTCMSKAYCKWPVIVAIIIASLIVLSLLMCAARCLCCGLECCCGCFACCNACCPSPRRRSKKDYSPAPQQAWPQPPPQPQPYQQPYQWQNPMSYGAPQQTAVFDSPSRGGPGPSGMAVNSDALPAMPSWATATSRHVEDTEYHGAGADEEGIAMGAVGATEQQWRPQGAAADDEQRVPMLAPQPQTPNPYSYNHTDGAVSPYAPQSPTGYARDELPSPTQQYQQPQTTSFEHDYNTSYQSYGAGAAAIRPNMTGTQPPSYQSRSPISPTSVYTYDAAPPARQDYGQTPYPVQSSAPQDYGQTPYPVQSPTAGWGERSQSQVARKPVSGSWREV